MPAWRTIRYIHDYRDPSEFWHRVGEVDRVLEPIAIDLVTRRIADHCDADGHDIWNPPEKIVPGSVAIAEIPSDNVVMSDSQVAKYERIDDGPSLPADKFIEMTGRQQALDLGTSVVPMEQIENPALREFIPSPQQEDAFGWVVNGDGHAVMIAVAGAGKTTTLIECFKRIVKSGKRVVFLAFNNRIAAEIREKVEAAGLQGNVEIKTFHAYGMKLWFKANRSCRLEGDDDPKNAGYFKFDRIVTELESGIYQYGERAGTPVMVQAQGGMVQMQPFGQMPYMYKSFVRKAWGLARQQLFGFEVSLMDKAAWLKLVETYELDEEIAEVAEKDGITLSTMELQEHVGLAINWTVRVIRHGISIAHEVVDFEDVIYMPLIAQLQVWQNDWVLVDEAQDTNPSRRAFVRKILKPNGRSLWVGDPAQAIYHFTGADSNSLDIIRERFNAATLKLTVTYRCPKVVVRMAQQWVSHIEAHETAPEGSSLSIAAADMLKQGLRQEKGMDVVLCRNNKPLADLCLALLKAGVPCHVEGKDFGEAIAKLVRRWKSVKTVDQLVKTLENYKDLEMQKAIARGKENKAERIMDMVDTLLGIIADMPRGCTLSMVENKVDDMFVDTVRKDGQEIREKKPTLTLSSIHKAKGREWNRVFWYGPKQFQPSKYARTEEAQQQERNLMYVAVTRTKQTIVTVAVPTTPGEKIKFNREEAKAA